MESPFARGIYAIGNFNALKYIAKTVTCIMPITGVNFPLYNNGMSIGREMVKNTNIGEIKRKETSICLLTTVLDVVERCDIKV